MRGRNRRLISMILMVALLWGIHMNVAAEEPNPWEGMESELLEDVLESESIWQNVLRGTYLQTGTCKITNKGNNRVLLSGSTDAYQKCDSIVVTVYLDRYENGEWVEVSSITNRANDALTVSTSGYKTVTPGYYYRARGYHTIYKGNTTESAASLTDGIWI